MDLSQLLQDCLSPNREILQNSERILNEYKTTKPVEFVKELIEHLLDNKKNDPQEKMLVSILLRNTIKIFLPPSVENEYQAKGNNEKESKTDEFLNWGLIPSDTRKKLLDFLSGSAKQERVKSCYLHLYGVVLNLEMTLNSDFNPFELLETQYKSAQTLEAKNDAIKIVSTLLANALTLPLEFLVNGINFIIEIIKSYSVEEEKENKQTDMQEDENNPVLRSSWEALINLEPKIYNKIKAEIDYQQIIDLVFTPGSTSTNFIRALSTLSNILESDIELTSKQNTFIFEVCSYLISSSFIILLTVTNQIIKDVPHPVFPVG
ncbi:hypothetical protein M0812_20632 [Anaeramoeba flamelloides]|uniref:Uncharacterized protein n=1 Tax=Anaeramoeba flamelloides TaxID=1746091 RepID=A0AAV7YPJ4_9EUKA|nr:hypothetical protein M0812_20632 [Anaeramoeba flamelloides]